MPQFIIVQSFFSDNLLYFPVIKRKQINFFNFENIKNGSDTYILYVPEGLTLVTASQRTQISGGGPTKVSAAIRGVLLVLYACLLIPNNSC